MKVILVGPCGVGKTTAGRVVAKELGFDFYDMDFLLHEKFDFPKKNNYSSEEFNEKRKIEFDILETILSRDDFVLATCGGLIEGQPKENVMKVFDVLRFEMNVVLIAPFENLVMTKKFLMKRFGLTGVTRDESMVFDRDFNVFRRLAKMIVYTKDDGAGLVAKKILEIIK